MAKAKAEAHTTAAAATWAEKHAEKRKIKAIGKKNKRNGSKKTTNKEKAAARAAKQSRRHAAEPGS